MAAKRKFTRIPKVQDLILAGVPTEVIPIYCALSDYTNNRRCPLKEQYEDLNAIVYRLQDDGFDTVGEVQDYADVYRLVCVRGPEGLIVELAENIASARAS